jgi:hypothetical protein
MIIALAAAICAAVAGFIIGCKDIHLLAVVEDLVLTGKWDKGSFDQSLFGP